MEEGHQGKVKEIIETEAVDLIKEEKKGGVNEINAITA